MTPTLAPSSLSSVLFPSSTPCKPVTCFFLFSEAVRGILFKLVPLLVLGLEPPIRLCSLFTCLPLSYVTPSKTGSVASSEKHILAFPIPSQLSSRNKQILWLIFYTCSRPHRLSLQALPSLSFTLQPIPSVFHPVEFVFCLVKRQNLLPLK